LFYGQQPVNLLIVSKLLYHNQSVVISAICIPWMLVLKPYYLHKQHAEWTKERKLRGDVELQDVNLY